MPTEAQNDAISVDSESLVIHEHPQLTKKALQLL